MSLPFSRKIRSKQYLFARENIERTLGGKEKDEWLALLDRSHEIKLSKLREKQRKLREKERASQARSDPGKLLKMMFGVVDYKNPHRGEKGIRVGPVVKNSKSVNGRSFDPITKRSMGRKLTYYQRYYRKHKSMRKRYAKIYYLTHRSSVLEKKREKDREFWKNVKELKPRTESKTDTPSFNEKGRDGYTRAREYYVNNRDKINARRREYYRHHRDEILRKKREYERHLKKKILKAPIN